MNTDDELSGTQEVRIFGRHSTLDTLKQDGLELAFLLYKNSCIVEIIIRE